MPATEKGKNIHQRMLAITAEAEVAKGGTAPGAVGGFAFHKIDDVESVLKPLFVKHGVTAMPDVIEMDFSPNGAWNIATARVEITFANADAPEDKITLTGFGQGFDKQDKGAGKAISYATKNCYLSAFHLKGMPDNESDAHDAHVPTPPSDEALDPDTFVTFGKNKGKRWSALSTKQLTWYAEKGQDERTRVAAQTEIEARKADIGEITEPAELF